MKELKKRLYIYLFGEYNPQEDTKYLVAFICSILFIAGIIFLFNYTSDFRKQACIEREMYNGHVSREQAEKIVEQRWFYF